MLDLWLTSPGITLGRSGTTMNWDPHLALPLCPVNCRRRSEEDTPEWQTLLCARGSPHQEESAVRGGTMAAQCDKVYNGESVGHCGGTEVRGFIYHGEMGNGRRAGSGKRGRKSAQRSLSAAGIHPGF